MLNAATALTVRAAVDAADIRVVRAFVDNMGLTEEPVDALANDAVVAAAVVHLCIGIEEGAVDLDGALAFFAPGGEGYDTPC